MLPPVAACHSSISFAGCGLSIVRQLRRWRPVHRASASLVAARPSCVGIAGRGLSIVHRHRRHGLSIMV